MDKISHTTRDKQKLLTRVRHIRGQVEAIERALDGEAGCDQVMHLIAPVAIRFTEACSRSSAYRLHAPLAGSRGVLIAGALAAFVPRTIWEVVRCASGLSVRRGSPPPDGSQRTP
jgi:hypothetical protein